MLRLCKIFYDRDIGILCPGDIDILSPDDGGAVINRFLGGVIKSYGIQSGASPQGIDAGIGPNDVKGSIQTFIDSPAAVSVGVQTNRRFHRGVDTGGEIIASGVQ